MTEMSNPVPTPRTCQHGRFSDNDERHTLLKDAGTCEWCVKQFLEKKKDYCN